MFVFYYDKKFGGVKNGQMYWEKSSPTTKFAHLKNNNILTPLL
jgi:hypothetical protein